VLAPHFHSEGVPERKVSEVHDLMSLVLPRVCPVMNRTWMHHLNLISSCGLYYKQCCPYLEISTAEHKSNRLQFAIRVNSRNHNVLKRDDIIRRVASVVGPGHKVDLKNYDLLILIELYKVCHHFGLERGLGIRCLDTSATNQRYLNWSLFIVLLQLTLISPNRTPAA
jgi:hypothetical protein